MVKKHKPKDPPVPNERHETIRKEMLSLLQSGPLTAKDISAEIHISEKDVYDHLEHIERSIHKTEHPLHIEPAECTKCGFVFKKRERLKKPGKCPVCRSEHIQDPLFMIRDRNAKI